MHRKFEEAPKADIKRLQADVRDLEKDINAISYHLESAWFQSSSFMIGSEVKKALIVLERVQKGLEKVVGDLACEEIKNQKDSIKSKLNPQQEDC